MGRFSASHCLYTCTNLGKELTAALCIFNIPFCTIAADTVHQTCQKTNNKIGCLPARHPIMTKHISVYLRPVLCIMSLAGILYYFVQVGYVLILVNVITLPKIKHVKLTATWYFT